MLYLVHFARPYKHAQHYLGYTGGTLKERFERHRSLAPLRRGSALLRAVMQAGIEFKVVRTWEGDREAEKRKKVQGGHRRKCPVCCGRAKYEDLTCLIQRESETKP